MGSGTYVDATAGLPNRDINSMRSDAFYNMLTQQGGVANPLSWLQGAQNTMNPWNTAMTNQMTALNTALNRDPAANYALFQGVNPQLGNLAGQMADMAVSPFGQSMDALAAQRSTANRRALEQRMAAGGLFGVDSGAARRSIGEGVSQPWAEAAANVANTRAGIFNSIYNPQANQVLGAYFNEPMQRLQAMQGIGNAYGNMFNAQAGMGSNLLGQLGTQSEQMMVAPQFQYQPNMWEQILQAGVGGLGGGIFGNLGQGIGTGLGNWASSWFNPQSRYPGTGQGNNPLT